MAQTMTSASLSPQQTRSDPAAAKPRWEAFVINLARAAERWAFMERQLRALAIPFHRVEAVDGQTLRFPMPEVSDSSYRYLHGRHLSPSEVGCYLSHIKAIDIFLAGDLDYALILEDDALMERDIGAVIDAALDCRGDWDILRLSTVNTGRYFPVTRVAGRALGVCFTREKGAAGYVLSRRAAQLFRERLMPMRLAYDIAFDLEYLMGLKALGAMPMPINQETRTDTQIQYNIRKLPAWRYLTVFPFRAAIETARVVSRLGLYLLLRFRHRAEGR